MTTYDVIIRNGLIIDGSGSAPYHGDLAIQGDRIAALGDLGDARGTVEIDAGGKAITPGFINMLSWSVESLIEDGRSQSEIRQGVTLEVMGEGFSFGPLSEEMKQAGTRGILGNYDIQYDIEWTTLGEYLEYLEKRGVSPNIASFVGTSTLRIHTVGYDDRDPTSEELSRMEELLRQAMTEGAMGLSSALIYPPASYAYSEELIQLASVVAEYDGLYISHVRGEGNTLIEAIEEFIDTVSMAQVRGEIYHLKAAGEQNWDMMDEVIDILNESREDGLPITADMYPYPYSGTGLDSCIPPWAHDGGRAALNERLRDPETRARIKEALAEDSFDWENMYFQNGPDRILLAGFRQEHLKPLTGKTLAQVAAERGTAPDDTLLDLVLEDDSRVFCMYFTMSEDNLRKQITLPYISFCSDAESQAPEGVFLKSSPHPRAYGAFARVLARYVRDEQIIPLEEAIRRMTSLPADNLRIKERGRLQPGHYADVVVFDPATIQDHATPENPHQYATGVQHVFVNGVQVLRDGEHTGAKPGHVVRGPGYGKQPFEAVYPAELLPLFKLGLGYDGTYAEFGLRRDQIPDLIRIVKDSRLYVRDKEDDPVQYAPIHAAWMLSRLGAAEALEAVSQLIIYMHPIGPSEILSIMETFGPVAIAEMTKIIDSPLLYILSRLAAAAAMTRIGLEHGPMWATVVENLFLERLRQHNTPILLLAGLAAFLERLETENEEVELAVKAARKHAVSMGLAKSWDETYKLLRGDDELKVEPGNLIDSDEGDDDDDLPPADTSAPTAGWKAREAKAAKKKKAKRKMTDKIKKQQRKKKR